MLGPERAAQGTDRLVRQFETNVVRLVAEGRRHFVMLDLVMLIIGERQAEAHLLEPGKRILIFAADVEPLAAQFDERHFLMLVVVVMVVIMVLVVVPMRAAMQAAAVRMTAFIVMAVPGQAIFAALARISQDRKSVVEGKSVSVRVDHGGRRIIKKK